MNSAEYRHHAQADGEHDDARRRHTQRDGRDGAAHLQHLAVDAAAAAGANVTIPRHNLRTGKDVWMLPRAILLHTGTSLVLDKNTLAATMDGEALELTTAEFKLLAYLMERPGKVQDRYELQKVLFGYADTTQSRALDTHVKRLRQKLGEHAACIVTERGSGYYFTPEPTNTDR